MAARPHGRHRRGKTKRRRAHHPFRQGDLDGLCGIYAIINALRALCPELSGKLSADLFQRLVRCLRGRTREPLDVITGGINFRTVRYLLGIAIDFVEFRLGIAVEAAQLPKPVRGATHFDDLSRGLRDKLAPYRIAIIGVQGRMSHWTVATRIGSKHLFLLDSGTVKRFRLTHCAVVEVEGRYAISPREVIIVARVS